MPIDELTNFRSRYPQYNDLNDLDLARSLGQKYPAYQDLESKVLAEQAPTPEPTSYLKEGAKMLVRMGPPILAGITGYGLPATALAAGAGEAAAQYLFGESFNPKQIAFSTAVGAIPGMKFAGVTSPLARIGVRGAEGAVFGAGTTGISSLLEGQRPTLRQLGTGAAFGGVLGGGLQAVQATRGLFAGQRGGAAGNDVPTGLTDEVFGAPQPPPGPPEFPSDIGAGPARESADVFQQAFTEGQTPQGAAGITRRLTEEQVLGGLRQAAPIYGPPRPPKPPEFPSDIGAGPAYQSAEAIIAAETAQERLRQSPLGRLMLGKQVQAASGPPTEAIPLKPEMPLDWTNTGNILRQRLVQGGPLTEEQTTTLTDFINNPRAPKEIKTLSNQLLDPTTAPAEPAKAPEVPVVPKADLTQEALPTAPPRVPLGVKSTITPMQRQAEAGDVVSAIMDVTGNKGVQFSKDVRGDVRQSLIASGLPKNLFNYKSGMPSGDVIDSLTSRGFPVQNENDLIEALRARAQTGKVTPAKLTSDDEMLQAIRGETQPGNLVQLLTQLPDPESVTAKAAASRLKELGVNVELPETVHISEVGDPTLKGVLQGGMFGDGPTFTKEQVNAAEVLAKKIRPNPNPLDDLQLAKKNGTLEAMAGTEPPTFQKTAAGEQGMIPGTEGRAVPQGGLQPGARQTEALTDLEKAALPPKQGDLIVGPRGGVGGPGNAATNSLNDDMNNWFDRLKAWGRSFRDTELRTQIKRLSDRTMSAQELARKYPEFEPIYQPFHDYPRAATNSHVEAITPLFEKDAGTPYFSLADKQRQAVDDLAMQHKVNRQGQPRMTAAQIKQSRGFTDDMIGAFNDVMDYGKAQLDAMRNWYVERGTPALMRTGMSEDAARATLEAQAAKALQGLDHWVPSYRTGDKTVTVRDLRNTDPKLSSTVEYRMEPNIKSRVEAAAELRQKYPDATRFKIEEGTVDNFVRSKAFDEIDMGTLEVLSRFARVDPTVSEEFMNQIRPALLGRSDALSHYKKFENIPGFKSDLREGLINTGKSTFNYIERQKAFTAATDALSQIDQGQQKEMFRFADQYIKDNMAAGDRKSQTLRDMTYTYILGGNLKQYPLQLSQFMTSVMPEGLKFGTVGDVAKAANTARQWTFSRNLKAAPEELRNVWEEAFKQGTMQPRVETFSGSSVDEIRGASKDPFSYIKSYRIEEMMKKQLDSAESKTAQNLKAARNLWMMPITDADMRTRFGAVTFFYDLGRNVKGMSIPDAQQFAITEAKRTNFAYGRTDSPQLVGRTGLALYANMFKSWPASQISFLRGLYSEANKEAMATGTTSLGGRLGAMGQAALAGPSPARALASSMGAMLALGGVMYNIPSPILAAMKAGLGVDPETEARKLLTGTLGLPQWGADVALRGVTSLAGVDMSRSFAIGDLADPTSIGANILGPAPATAEALVKGGTQLFKSAYQPFGPDVMDTLEFMSGGGVKNALKAARLWNDQGIATRYGTKLPGTEQLRRVDPYLQALGMTPLAVANAKALQQAVQQERTYHNEQQTNMMEKYARAIVNQDQDAVTALNQRIQQNNEDAMAKNRPDLIIKPDRAALRQRVAEMLSPGAALKRAPKNARQRLMELQDLYLGPPAAPE